MDARGLALLVASLALAGCAGSHDVVRTDSATDSAPTGGAGPIAEDPGAAPTWSVGDWWTYDVQYPNSGNSIKETIVVYKDDADNWYLSGDDYQGDELAEFSHYPTLGPWTRSGFEPLIHGAKIPFFRFPLADGKTWSDPYRSTPAAWTATAKGAGFELEMTSQDGQTVTYGYDRAVGFFTHLEYGFGTPNTVMKLVASGHGFDKPVTVLTFTQHIHGGYQVFHANPTGGPPAGQAPFTNFTVDGDKPLLWGFFYGGAPGTYDFLLGPANSPQGQGVEQHPQTTDATAKFLWGDIPKPTAGPWGLTTGGVTQEAGGFVFAEALEVAVEKVTPAKAA